MGVLVDVGVRVGVLVGVDVLVGVGAQVGVPIGSKCAHPVFKISIDRSIESKTVPLTSRVIAPILVKSATALAPAPWGIAEKGRAKVFGEPRNTDSERVIAPVENLVLDS